MYNKESNFWNYEACLDMISWMECYYLDARTSDTICSYQFQSPQIETHNTQEEVKGCNGAKGNWLTQKGKDKQTFLKQSKQSNEIDT